jgi:hypothetical protein
VRAWKKEEIRTVLKKKIRTVPFYPETKLGLVNGCRIRFQFPQNCFGTHIIINFLLRYKLIFLCFFSFAKN